MLVKYEHIFVTFSWWFMVRLFAATQTRIIINVILMEHIYSSTWCKNLGTDVSGTHFCLKTWYHVHLLKPFHVGIYNDSIYIFVCWNLEHIYSSTPRRNLRMIFLWDVLLPLHIHPSPLFVGYLVYIIWVFNLTSL